MPIVHSNFSLFDHEMMALAISLAAKGRFTTSPNPNVGCVITHGEQIVGQGYHQKAGTPHAEVHALAMAKKAAKAATCYVTLEPCSHFGRTPPCALALIDAGVKRVVIAMQDPNPKVSGRGIILLEDAGIIVEIGLLNKEALALNPGFIMRMTKKRPRLTLKLAASLDAKTALANGNSQWITSEAARFDVQKFRAQSCAILTGADTVLVDKPSLNVRWQQLNSVKEAYSETDLRQPTRIIIDSKNRISANNHIFTLPGKVWLARHKPTGEFDSLKFEAQVSELAIPLAKNGYIDLAKLLAKLGELEVNELWLETGSNLAGAFIEAKLVDRLILYLAPKIMGSDAKSLVELNAFTEMSQVESWQWQDVRKVGNDMRFMLTPPHQTEL